MCGSELGLPLGLVFPACKMGWLIASGFGVVGELTAASAESMSWLLPMSWGSAPGLGSDAGVTQEALSASRGGTSPAPGRGSGRLGEDVSDRQALKAGEMVGQEGR